MKILFIGIIYFLLAMVINRVYYLLYRYPVPVMETTAGAGSKIIWDTASLQQISPEAVAAFYPRMLQLQDGSLLVVYASKGNIITQKSFDGGRQWQTMFVAAEKATGVNMDTPELLQLINGELLLCYNGRPEGALKGLPEAGKRFDIRIKKSNDKGLTWKDEKILYKAGESFKDGCWEPAAIQLPTGEIQLFFSDEGIYTTSDEQNISLLRSSDNGVSWSANPQIISFRKNSRDGMPVPVWLPAQNKIALAIEDPGNRNFKPYIIHSPHMGKWMNTINNNDSARVYALANKMADTIYAGAAYLRRLSTGTTVLSYQSTENRMGKNTTADAVMVVATGDKYAGGFGNKTTPFTIPEGYHALWNSLCITRGDTIIALTSTNAFSKSASEIWMIKGYAE